MCPLIAGFFATKWLNISVRVSVTEVSAECRFITVSGEENLGAHTGVHLIEGVRLIQVSLYC